MITAFYGSPMSAHQCRLTDVGAADVGSPDVANDGPADCNGIS
jgi:hypothetical protein